VIRNIELQRVSSPSRNIDRSYREKSPAMDASTTTSPSLNHRNNDVGHEEGDCSRPILRRMRRSCSECGRRKKSCDGQRPCG
ncbi:unnamed protein product, partial [Ectocarpus sp. 12 AP-2014]